MTDTVALLILTLVLVQLGAILYFRKVNKTNQDTKRILELTAKELNDQREANIKIIQLASAKKLEINQVLEENKNILEYNNKVLRGQQTELFHVKESALFLYDNYKEVVSILSGTLLKEGYSEKELATVYHNAVTNLNFVENYFINTFKIHPDAYKKSKSNIIGSNENGMNWLSQSSIN